MPYRSPSLSDRPPELSIKHLPILLFRPFQNSPEIHPPEPILFPPVGSTAFHGQDAVQLPAHCYRFLPKRLPIARGPKAAKCAPDIHRSLKVDPEVVCHRSAHPSANEDRRSAGPSEWHNVIIGAASTIGVFTDLLSAHKTHCSNPNPRVIAYTIKDINNPE